MIMKMHSYMATNGYLKHLYQQSTKILIQLRDETSRVGGWEKGLRPYPRR
jgi:sterol O-acyltransferase